MGLEWHEGVLWVWNDIFIFMWTIPLTVIFFILQFRLLFSRIAEQA